VSDRSLASDAVPPAEAVFVWNARVALVRKLVPPLEDEGAAGDSRDVTTSATRGVPCADARTATTEGKTEAAEPV
jgi:hypothetical protein